MIYWFANFPADPERLTYDAVQYETDQVYLTSLVEKINGLGDGDFSLTTQERRCRYCRYRSLCQRGDRAGLLDDAEDSPVVDDDRCESINGRNSCDLHLLTIRSDFFYTLSLCRSLRAPKSCEVIFSKIEIASAPLCNDRLVITQFRYQFNMRSSKQQPPFMNLAGLDSL